MKFYNCLILLLTVKISIAKLSPPENQNEHNFPLNIINELNEKLDIKWNAVVALESKQEMDDVLKSLSLPVLFISKNIDTNIDLLYSKQVLTIVLLQQSTLNNVYEIVQNLLKQSQFTHILWIIPEASVTDLWSLAEKNWDSGYTNVLYYTNEGLFTYHPVPNITIHRIKHITEYVERKEVHDFQGYPLKVPIVSIPPRSYRFQDRSGKITNTGYLYNMIKIFAKYYRFQLIDIQDYYEVFDYEQLKQGANNKSFDIIPLPLYFYDRFAGSSSDVIFNVQALVIAPYPPPLARTEYFMHPFTVNTRICILLLLLFCASAVSFIYYQKKHCTNEIDFGKSTLYVLALFICQYQANFKIETFMQKLICILMFLNGFILTNLYLAKLSSLFVQDIYEAKIEKLEDLNKIPNQILINLSSFKYLDNLPNIQEIVAKKAKFANNTEIFIAHRDLNSSFCLIAAENKVDFLIFQQRNLKTPRVYKINDPIFIIQEYFTGRRDLPYLQLFNRYLKYIAESGILAKFMEDTNFDGIHSGEIRFFSDSEISDDILLDFNYFYALFRFLLIGLLVSVIVFILEIVYAKYMKKMYVK